MRLFLRRLIWTCSNPVAGPSVYGLLAPKKSLFLFPPRSRPGRFVSPEEVREFLYHSHGLRRWICSPRGRVRPLRVVYHPPFLDHYLRLLQRVENFSVQALIPQFPVETLAVAVLPRTSRFDVQRPGAHFGRPFPQLFCCELRTE
jgi:hypothetical protein